MTDFPPSLLHVQRLPCRAGALTLPVHLLRYDLQRYDPAAFAQAGVAYPAAMDRCIPKRQAEYLFGRVAARRALAEAGWPDAQVGTGSQREPLWPAGALGAITHSGPYAAAAVARAGALRGVGIDIEAALAPDALTSTADYAMNAAEVERLRAHAALPFPLALAIAFSAKESIYKALFPTVGRYFGFEAVQVDALDAAGGTLEFTATETLCDGWRAGDRGRVHFIHVDAQTILTSYAW